MPEKSDHASAPTDSRAGGKRNIQGAGRRTKMRRMPSKVPKVQTAATVAAKCISSRPLKPRRRPSAKTNG